MGSGANQANGLSDAAVRPTEPIGGPNNGLWQSGSAKRGGATRDRLLADITIEQASGRDDPVMGLNSQQASPNCHPASGNEFRVHSGEGAQQINGLHHEEEPVAEEANGSSVHNANGDSYRSCETATGEGLPIQEDLARLSVQEQGDGSAVPQAPILPPGDQPGEANLVSMGNAEKPTENCCRPREIKQWNQQLTRQVAHFND